MLSNPIPAAELEKIKDAFGDLCQVIAQLRDPKDGCPWDLKQTHESLRTYLLEEAYEASAAMGSGDKAHMCEELGDVLLQVVLNAQLAMDSRDFSIRDVVQGITDKMIRRHPHVFADSSAKEDDELSNQWEAIKGAEKGQDKKDTLLGDLPSKDHYPATHLALKIGQRCRKIGFDWDTADQVFANLQSEIKELETEWIREWTSTSPERETRLRDELGDVYFSLAQLCRHMKLDPEIIAQDGNSKFIGRFTLMEKIAKEEGVMLQGSSLDEMQRLWNLAKTRQAT